MKSVPTRDKSGTIFPADFVADLRRCVLTEGVDSTPLVLFLRKLPRLLSHARSARAHGRGGRQSAASRGRINPRPSLSDRAVVRLLQRLDCDVRGYSTRTGNQAWPESWELAHLVAQSVDGEALLVHVLASWLEGMAPTTRRTYGSSARGFLRDLRLRTLASLASLPEQAGLTWQRELSRRLLPRSVNGLTAALNSFCGHCSRLGLQDGPWVALPAVRVTKGRWIDRDGVALAADELAHLWDEIATRPRRQFLALMIASLHGFRASEVASLTWGAIRHARRGSKPAPCVLHVVGKGGKHRIVQVHPGIRAYLEAQKVGKSASAYVLADEDGVPPSAQVVSAWAKDAFRRAGLEGYAHALRSTWLTLAVDNRQNSPLQVQQSGGWKDAGTMLGHYYKRRQVPLIRLAEGHGRY